MREPTTSTPSSSESGSPAFPPTANRSPGTAFFAGTIFLSAFLLFEIQPLIAREILPWFGGSAGVWTTCMLFFQLALLAGYGYAHFLAHRISNRKLLWVHWGLLALSLLCLPIIPGSWLRPSDGSLPLLRILGLLAVTVGLPYFLLASTSPLLQSWYAAVRGGAMPYRFFALSNFGSMLALITYPTLVEPQLPLAKQAWVWSGAYVIFAALAVRLSLSARAGQSAITAQAQSSEAQIGIGEKVIWLALSACASALLLAVTNHLTQNVAAIPFLWILPLSLYLLSFILTFESNRWYWRRVYLGLFAVAAGSMAYAVMDLGNFKDLTVLILLFTIGLFLCCMVCHGELARRKPASGHLTVFYLMISAGGAIGGLFVAGLAPIVFRSLVEFPIVLIATAAAVLAATFRGRPRGRDRSNEFERAQFWPLWIAGVGATVFLAAFLAYKQYGFARDAELLARNFYGAVRVLDLDDSGTRELAHGTINHGEQYLDPVRRKKPVTYYAPGTGIGRLMESVRANGPFRLGVVGLGTGTMAAFGRRGDTIHFYEINPLIENIARRQFRYLSDSEANITVTLGDARISLEGEPDQHYDVIVVDAFSGDAIPVHLLTREAYRSYWRHLKPDGVLAVHVSNKYLNLPPIVAAAAQSFGREAHLISNEKNEATRTFASDWVLAGSGLETRFGWISDAELEIEAPRGSPWTDDYSNLWATRK